MSFKETGREACIYIRCETEEFSILLIRIVIKDLLSQFILEKCLRKLFHFCSLFIYYMHGI